MTAVWARGARCSCPVIHPLRHQGGKSEYVTVRTTASKDAAKGTRGPSVQTQWMCTCNNHVRKRGCICLKMRQRSYNNQVLRRGCGVHAVPSSDAAVCATFKDVAVHTTVSEDRPRVPKVRKGSSIQMGLVRVWATITSGCARGAKGGHPVHPAGIKMVSQST